LVLPLSDLLVIFLGALSAGIGLAIGGVGFLLPVGLVVFVLYKIYRHFRPKVEKPAKK
jgi:chromate transport protein ChrA